MNNSKFVILIVFIPVLALIGGWFYWFQWRPSEIRSRCHAETLGRYETNLKEYRAKPNTNDNWAPGKVWTNWGSIGDSLETGGIWGWWYPTSINRESVESSYSSCLNSNGLK